MGGLGTCWAEKGLLAPGPGTSLSQDAPGCSESTGSCLGVTHWPLSRFRSKTSPAETEPISLQGGEPWD